MAQLTDLLQLRVTPTLTARLRSEAQRLGLRPADVARMALAQGLRDGVTIGNPSERQNTAHGAQRGDSKRK